MKSFLASIRLILTLDCKQSSRIVSESLDRNLSFSERWAVRLHYIACWSCRRFRKQIEFIRDAVRQADQLPVIESEGMHLSSDAKSRILKAMAEKTDDDE